MDEKQKQQMEALKAHADRLQSRLDRIAANFKKPRLPGVEWMASLIPEGKLGRAEVRHVHLKERDVFVHVLQAANEGELQAAIRPGSYAQLFVDGELMMSDTDHEIFTNRDLLRNAKGSVLIAGLGLGMVLTHILRNPRVHQVTVIEKSRDVIHLVEPHLYAWAHAQEGAIGFTVHQSDVFDWLPKTFERFDCIYFDIWPTISYANLIPIEKLKERYAPWLETGGWMRGWMEKYLRTGAKRMLAAGMDKRLVFDDSRPPPHRQGIRANRSP